MTSGRQKRYPTAVPHPDVTVSDNGWNVIIRINTNQDVDDRVIDLVLLMIKDRWKRELKPVHRAA